MRRGRKKNPPVQLEKKTIKAIIGILSLAFSTLLILSLFTNTGVLLTLKSKVYLAFGVGIVFIPPILVNLSFPLLGIKNRLAKVNVIFGSFGALLAILGLIASVSVNLSGSVGLSLWLVTKSFLTAPGAIFVLFFAMLICAVIALNANINQIFSTLSSSYKKVTSIFKIFDKFFAKKPSINSYTSATPFNRGLREIGNPKKQPTIEEILTHGVTKDPTQNKIWVNPPLSLLSDVRGGGANRGNTKQNAHVIEKTLESFNINSKVVELNPGPTVTQYALSIPLGTRLQRILNLEKDLALALKSLTGSVRIEAPIPGKDLIGIEIPNISPEVVSLKSVLTSDAVYKSKSKTLIGLGLDVAGSTIVNDIAKMPHVLIAGTTGSGKSVLLNAIISTILFRASPQEVKLILIDPKRVELTQYNDIPHLASPVIDDPEKALSALKWATQEMNRRLRLFHDGQVKNIAGYNELSGFQALPYIVIVIDELQNLMKFAAVDVQNTIANLAAMARSTGIHLVVATQRPSVDVITGTIKANIPCRIAFNVSSQIDSRVIIDQPGAEKLLGKGDMLYVPPDASRPLRIQGVFVSEAEVRNLINFLKSSGFAPEYTEEITQMPLGKGTIGQDGEKDPLFEDALRVVCQFDKASSTLLQTRLRVGYARAARILMELELAGIVGNAEGAKPREVFVKDAEEYIKNNLQSAAPKA